jgi:hypothetical protein
MGPGDGGTTTYDEKMMSVDTRDALNTQDLAMNHTNRRGTQPRNRAQGLLIIVTGIAFQRIQEIRAVEQILNSIQSRISASFPKVHLIRENGSEQEGVKTGEVFKERGNI